ncbi:MULTISPECIES: hypothetical protein [unclassified Streptomyces]|nr:hypothetical protein OG395_47260 [Streptomyces sp. NBC_01320]
MVSGSASARTVHTLHAAHRTLVMQVFGAPLRAGALLPSRP